MTTMQLNAALFRELNIIVTDEDLMKKAILALRRITMKRKVMDDATENVKDQELPESFKRLRGMAAITTEDIENDDRLAYIMSK